MDKARHPRADAGLRDGRRAVAVDGHELGLASRRDRARDVKHDVRPGHERLEGRVVVERTSHDAAAGSGQGLGGRRPCKAGHLLTAQPLEQVAADETGGAGDGYGHGRS
jgi:hypothetical protein